MEAESLTLGKAGRSIGAYTLVLSDGAIVAGIAMSVAVLPAAGEAVCLAGSLGGGAGRVAGIGVDGEVMFVAGEALAAATGFASGGGEFDVAAGFAPAGGADVCAGDAGFSAGVGGGAAASTFTICATGPLAFIAFSNGALVRSFASGWRFQCFATFLRPEM